MSWLSYKSVKLIKVSNTTLALIYYGIVLAILAYVVAFTIIIKKGYQEYDPLVGSTMTKVKGTAYTTTANGTRHVYDSNDLVVPALMKDSVFITTNLIHTRQTRGVCSGNDNKTELCECELGSIGACCANGDISTNGVKTGRCGSDGVYCAVDSWCPLEDDSVDNVLEQTRDFTIFVRSNVRFPKFNAELTNAGQALTLGKNLFRLEDILNATGSSFDDAKAKGAIVVMQMEFQCDLNKKEHCEPSISFMRLDGVNKAKSKKSISKGFNYRYQYKSTLPDGTTVRDLYKVYGLSLVVQQFGQAGKFNIVPLFVTLGSGLALLGASTLICDVIMQYFLPNKAKYGAKKFEDVPEEDAIDSENRHLLSQSR